MRNLIYRLRPEDIVNILFALFITILTLLKRERIPLWYIHLSIVFAVIMISLILALLNPRPGTKMYHVRNWYVVMVVPAMFLNLKGLIEAVNPVNWDLFLIEIDKKLFLGHSPSLLIEHLYNPILTEILQIAYVSYFFIPIILGVALYRKDIEAFRKTATTVLLTFYLSYAGYFIVPAIGPRFTLKEYFKKHLRGLLLTPYLKRLLNYLEPTPHDCFPSGHTAVSLVCLLMAKKYRTKFKLLLPMVTGLVISTVYHQYHYVIDVIAGIILAVISYFMGQYFHELWERKRLQKTL